MRKRLADLDLQLDVDTSVLDKLATLGFDPVYGARPLKRAIQKLIQDPLALMLLEGKFQPGDLVVFDHRLKHAAFGGSKRRRHIRALADPTAERIDAVQASGQVDDDT